MKSQDFDNSVNKLSVLLTENLPVISEKMALNAYAMMKNRIINDGTIGENKNLGTYSDNKLPAFFFKNKEANSSGKKLYENASKLGEGISYKEWREANNRPTDHVTLSFTGVTLNDIGVVKQLKDGVKIVTIVGAKNTKTRTNGKTTEQITEFLGDQYGDFLAPNKQEEQLLYKFLEKEVDKLIKIAFQ